MSDNEEEHFNGENADYEASFRDYNLAHQEYDETIDNPDAGHEQDQDSGDFNQNNDKQISGDEEPLDNSFNENDNMNTNNNIIEQQDNLIKTNADVLDSKNEDDNDSDDEKVGRGKDSNGHHKKETTMQHYSEPVKYESNSESSLNAENKITEPLSSSSASKHDDDERKIFVGGLHWETTVNDLRDYFSKFGKVVDSTLKTDPATGRSRGFGFVLFENVAAVDKVCAEKSHVLQGKTIDPKRAMSRLNNLPASKDPVKKIFVGGISPDMPESEIRSYFCKYGKIEEVELPFDRLKNQRRAYVFITFESEKIAEEACSNPKQKLGEREVDVRRATPRAENELNRGGIRGRGRELSYPGMYDYSAYYNYGYGYPGYSMPPGYDYSSYYGQDWSQYSQYAQQYAAYPTATAAAAAAAAVPSAAATYGYDYSSWYGQQDAASAGKAKRGATSAAYHPYSR